MACTHGTFFNNPLQTIRRIKEQKNAVGIDSDEWTGFAFGLGIDRMCALMYELDDIRLLFENDTRFLQQFK